MNYIVYFISQTSRLDMVELIYDPDVNQDILSAGVVGVMRYLILMVMC
jgi:hypothetical protein